MQISGPVYTPPGSQGIKISLGTVSVDFAHGLGGGNYSASSTYSGSSPSYAFDGLIGGWPTYWLGQGGGADWLRLDLGSGIAYAVTSYSVSVNTVPEPTRAPKNWTLDGSNDGSAWTTVDTQTNQTGWASGETRSFTVSSSAAYRYYRINITANNGDATYTQVGELYLYRDSTNYAVPCGQSGQFLDITGELPPEYSRILLVSQGLVMPPAQSRILLMTETTHYDNPGGKGDRTASVTMTTSASLLTGGTTFLIDGTYGNDGWFNGGACAGAWLQFQLSSARVITGFKFFQSGGSTHGVWKPQGSNDGSSWTDLGIEQTLGGSSTISEISFYSNVTAYTYYRILGISGNTSGGPWQQQIEFKIDGGTVLTYGVKADAGIFQPLTYATVYEGEPLTDFGDSLANWLDTILFDFATPQLAFGESLDLWSEFVNYAIGGGIAVESDLNLWADSNSLFPSLNIADSLQMSDSVSYTMFEIMLPLFLSVADSMIKTTGSQPTRFEMKDGVSYFLDAADAPLFISVDDLETFLADAVAISFVVFFNSAEAEAFDSMQWNWADSVELDLIRGESFAEWMFQTDEISLLFDSLVGVGDNFNLSDAVSNAAITEDFAVDDSFTLTDSVEVMLFVSLWLGVEDQLFMSDSVIGMKNSANVSYLRRYLNDVLN